ncbi:MAG TPA: tetratricopeptide repeat protein [Candidatus Binatia bacterium]
MRSSIIGVVSLALLAACSSKLAKVQEAPKQVIVQPEAPFQREPKVEVPAEAAGLAHFVKGQYLLFEGDFDQALAEFAAAAAADPGNAFLRFRVASLYVRKGDLKKALSEAEEGVRLAPDAAEGHLLLAGLYSALGEDARGLKEYEATLRGDPDNQEALLYLGALQLKIGDYDKATKTLEKLLAVNPNSVLGYYYLGRVRAKSQLYLAAEESYRKALELNPKAQEVLMDLALVYELEGKTEEAAQTYQKVLQVDPSNVWATKRLGDLYVGQNKLDDALSQFQTLERVEADPREARTKIGLIYFERGDFDRAITEFNLVLATDPDNDRVRYYLGSTYAEMKASDRALEEFQRIPDKSEYFADARLQLAFIYDQKNELPSAIEAVKDALARKKEPKEQRDVLNLLASFYRKGKDYPKAIDTLQSLIKLDPKNDQAHFQLGAVYDESNNKDKMLEQMKLAIDLNPQNAQALNYLGYSLAERGVRLDEAESLILRALKVEPNEGAYIDSLGWVYYQRGDYQRAAENLERASELINDDPVVTEHLGDAYDKLGKTDSALVRYREVVKRSKEEEQLRRVKEKIKLLERRI